MESFLILDAESALRERLSHYFGAQGFSIDVAPDSEGALQLLEQHIFDVVIFDVDVLETPPEDLLRVVKENNIHAVVIAMCVKEKFDEAIRAIREGASDFILKPINLAELEIKVDKGLELKRLNKEGNALRGERALIYKTRNFIGRSPEIRKVLALVEKVAPSSSSVILIGETGTGKELLAGAIHYNSPRARNAFVRVNCATLPDTLLESELFGHERGAFTGAEKLRIGRFEQGNGGSVFLDEIADVTPSTQAKLLRVLQEHEFERLGSNRTIRVDVRIIAATNKDLEKEIAEGRFREDLYYRLNVVTIRIPPLREREGDVEPIADFFLHKFSQVLNKKMKKIDPAAMRPPEGLPMAGEHQGAGEHHREGRPHGRDGRRHARGPEPAVQARASVGPGRGPHSTGRVEVGGGGEGPPAPGPFHGRVGAERGGAAPGSLDEGPELQDQAVRDNPPDLETEQGIAHDPPGAPGPDAERRRAVSREESRLPSRIPRGRRGSRRYPCASPRRAG